jgi:histone H4
MAKGKSSGAGKRVKKILRSNASSVSAGSIRRLARRGGVKRIAAPVYGEVRDVLRRFVDGVVRDATAFTEHGKRRTVSVQDIVAALRKRGRAIYGF